MTRADKFVLLLGEGYSFFRRWLSKRQIFNAGIIFAASLLLSGLKPVCASGTQPMPAGYGLGFCVWADKKPEPALRLYLRNGKQPGAHYHMVNYSPIVLGEIRLPDVPDAGWEVADADPVSRSLLLGGKASGDAAVNQGGDAFVRVTASRLVPAILFELQQTESLELFAGDKNPQWVPWRKGDGLSPDAPLMVMSGHDEFELRKTVFKPPMPLGQPRAPRHFAWSDGQTVRFGAFSDEATSLPGVENGWLLVWYGPDGWFIAGESTMEMMLSTRDARPDIMPARGDAPVLFVFSHPPSITLTDHAVGLDSSLVFEFYDSAEAKMAALPLFGYAIPTDELTRAWSAAKALPDAIKRQCDGWAQRLGQYPLTVEETASYDRETDTVAVKNVFSYAVLREGASAWAPLPPMLELARRRGFPVSVPGPLFDSGTAVYCGPFAGVDGVSESEVLYAGLGKYVWEAPVPGSGSGAAGGNAAWVENELLRETEKILDAGHLASVHLPFKVAWAWSAFLLTTMRHVYSEPGLTLRMLSEALPFLPQDTKKRVVDYLVEERNAFPPESLAHLPSGKGARREGWLAPESFLAEVADTHRKDNFHIKNDIVPAQALYDLAAYYMAAGPERIRDDGFDLAGAAAKTVVPFMEREEWATLGWYSWPVPRRDPQYFASYGWNTTADINRQLAGLIGCARLARMAGDRAWEDRAMASLARALAHRCAIGKYAGWLYEVGGILFPPPQGFLPSDDPRSVNMTEATAILGYGINQAAMLPYFSDEEGPYMALVPETARFMADCLKPEAAGFAKMTAAFYPDAFMTLGTPHRIAEWWHNYPQDSEQIFLVNAWILGRDGDWLKSRLDVPLAPVGDLYYIRKLMAASAAYRGVEWRKWNVE